MSDELEDLGPIDYLVVEFPGNRMTGEGLPLLLDLVDRGIIRVLDLVFVRKDRDGSVSVLEANELSGDGGLDITLFEGASSGLLGRDDLAEAGSALEPGNCAGVVVYENLWAEPLAAALRRSGARWVAGGRVQVQALMASLDAAEAARESTHGRRPYVIGK
ncbi:DUF6325 family protein [Streptacidiphilus griseoplanus]|uniref:DUF6325 family protein n=1 Tax=Peterkaempfera griseoplana TaxID=66896 RepID=UPI000B22B8AE|nr:DUF6325 family protein [Peterkaempfera griseoplana]